MLQGTVTSIESREVKTKFGLKPVYDVYVDGNKFSWGFKDPTKMMVSVGSKIEFDYTSDKYGNKITDSTVKVLTMGGGAAATPSPVKTGSSGSRGFVDVGFPVPATSEKISIIRQNALTNARELVCSFPGNFGVSDSVESLEVIKVVLSVAREFADYTSGRDVLDAIERLTADSKED